LREKSVKKVAPPAIPSHTESEPMSLLAFLPLLALATTPPNQNVSVSIMHAFGDPNVVKDGVNPVGSLAKDAQGDYYGATVYGGVNFGTVFQLTPAGHITILNAFDDPGTTNNYGQTPFASPSFGSNGILYGTCETNSTTHGVLYSITTTGHEAVLHSFPSGGLYPRYLDGAEPESRVIEVGGQLLTTTQHTAGASPIGYGTVSSFDLSGNATILHNFADGTVPNDGTFPSSGLFEAANGNLYGTTETGGTAGKGIIYHVNGGAYAIDHDFLDGSTPNDGSGPIGLCAGPGGLIYGVCSEGGLYGKGMIYWLNGSHVTVIYNFGDPDTEFDGSNPLSMLTEDTDGSFWGTTRYGGSAGSGTVYRFDPTTKVMTIMHSFGDGTVAEDGALPMGDLVHESPGVFVGTTYGGGAYGKGTAFKIIYTSTTTGASPYLVSVTANPTSVIGPAGSLGTATLSSAANQLGGVTVTLKSSSVAAVVPKGVTIPIGVSKGTFPITTVSVTTPVVATISGTWGALTKTATLTVSPRPALAVQSVSVPGFVAAGTAGTGTVQLNETSTSATVVALKCSAPTLATVPATCTVPAGALNTTFSITAAATTVPAQVTVTATYQAVSNTSNKLGIYTPETITTSKPSVTGGTVGEIATVHLGYITTFSANLTPSSGSALVTVPASVGVPAGVSAVAFPVTVLPTATDTLVSVITIGPLFGAPTQTPIGVGTFTDLSPRVLSLACYNSPLPSGTMADFALHLNGPVPSGGLTLTATGSDSSILSGTFKMAGGTSAINFALSTRALALPHTAGIKVTGLQAAATTLVALKGVPIMTISPNPVVAGGSATATVTFGGVATTTAFTLTVKSAQPTVVVPGTVAVAKGVTSVTFPITTKPTAKGAEVQRVIVSVTGGVSAAAVLVVNPTP
jgi:uncharacterized repeat protein (TIGR03803 family)